MLNILDNETVALDENDNSVIIIDQTKLPNDIIFLKLSTAKEIWEAIYRLSVRGAPAIGVTAAFGIYILAKAINTDNFHDFHAEFIKQKDYLNSSRPTAVNLSWALARMENVLNNNKELPILAIKEALRLEAHKIKAEDIEVCRLIGEHGLTLLKHGDGILTHCNAGQLAACKYGTATAPIYLGQERGYRFRVFADETRPLLQGARLTAYELVSKGVDVTLICDNMSAAVMQKGLVQAVLVGCDRVAANGDAANKIGTAVVAAVARHYGVPFYVCAPASTIDFSTKSGEDIPIEERLPSEITEMWYQKRMAPPDVKVFNPSFDVTGHELITAIITEHGIAKPPFTDSLRKILT
ncbi:MAG: S-methyl-5-thioribose-1-phosphate isomerase [Lachnospiraceae bacterium]|nr:S-methyl-5-thioribose-1-phosphate isomerase [Lachnospiraceae bacterium]